MKNISIKPRRLAVLVISLFLITAVTSCEKDDKVSSGKVELLSFGPTGVKHGQDIRFIGNNLNKVTEIEFTGGVSIPKAEFKEHTAELIVVTVPPAAERGKVTLKTPDGDIVSKAVIDFEVPVVITEMTAKARPEENITIKGDFLNWVESVQFESDLVVTDFVSRTQHELIVKVPKTAQTGVLVLTTGGTEPLTIETETPLEVNLPAITSLTTAAIRPEGNLTINGSDLDLVQSLTVPGVSEAITSFVSHTADQIVVKLPKEAKAGKVTLKAYSGLETVSAGNFTILLPAVSSLAPINIERGQNLTIKGTNLDLATGVVFKGALNPVTSFVSRSLTEIVVKVPEDASKGVIGLQAVSGVVVESTDVLEVAGSLPPPPPLGKAFYRDDLENGWQKWSGWGAGSSDLAFTGNVREGNTAIQVTFGGGWGGALQLGGGNAPTAGFTEFVVSIYGTPGSGGKKINLNVKGSSPDSKAIEIVEGEWTDFRIPLADYGNPETITEVQFQDQGWAGTIYVDFIGLR